MYCITQCMIYLEITTFGRRYKINSYIPLFLKALIISFSFLETESSCNTHAVS